MKKDALCASEFRRTYVKGHRVAIYLGRDDLGRDTAKITINNDPFYSVYTRGENFLGEADEIFKKFVKTCENWRPKNDGKNL